MRQTIVSNRFRSGESVWVDWRTNQVDALEFPSTTVPISPVAKQLDQSDKIMDALQGDTAIDPISAAIALTAVRYAERVDEIGTLNELNENHRRVADMILRRLGGIET